LNGEPIRSSVVSRRPALSQTTTPAQPLSSNVCADRVCVGLSSIDTSSVIVASWFQPTPLPSPPLPFSAPTCSHDICYKDGLRPKRYQRPCKGPECTEAECCGKRCPQYGWNPAMLNYVDQSLSKVDQFAENRRYCRGREPGRVRCRHPPSGARRREGSGGLRPLVTYVCFLWRWRMPLLLHGGAVLCWAESLCRCHMYDSRSPQWIIGFGQHWKTAKMPSAGR